MTADPLDVALRVAQAIEAVGGNYFLGGSLASSLQGEPRATNDIDIVLEIPIGAIDQFCGALGPDFEVDREMLRDALLHGRSCNVFFLPTVMKVDLFAVGASAYDEVEFSRRRPVVIRETGETLVVKSPEDSALRKLWWYRQGGDVSERQWRDVIEVLRIGGDDLDSAYMELWSEKLGVSDLLGKALREANEVPR